MNYLVLYVSDIEASKVFYEQLGIASQKEQHGTGPEHYSLNCGSLLLELYPQGKHQISHVRIGLHGNWPGHIDKVLSDPDGNIIELLDA